jgi:hypothetical protein
VSDSSSGLIASVQPENIKINNIRSSKKHGIMVFIFLSFPEENNTISIKLCKKCCLCNADKDNIIISQTRSKRF